MQLKINKRLKIKIKEEKQFNLEALAKVVIPVKTGIQSVNMVPRFCGDKPGFPLEFIPYLIRDGNDKQDYFPDFCKRLFK